MSLFRRTTTAPQTLRQAFPEPVISPFPGTSVYSNDGLGGRVSIDSAMQVSAVWASVRLLSDTVSMMPLRAYTMAGDVRVPTELPSLLQKPSDDATLPDWLYMLMVSLLLRGNAYGRITARDSLNTPTFVDWLHPDRVTPKLGDSGRLTFQVDQQDKPLERREVFHVRGYRMPGQQLGLSPIQYAARAIQTEHAVQDFAQSFFADGAHPSSILYSDNDFNQEQSRSMKERFMAAVQGREPAILTGGLKYQQIQISPEESQFLLTKKYGVPEIARLYGIPPEMIAGEAGNSMSYSNREQRAVDYLTYSVQAWLVRIEAALSELLPGKRHVRFDASVLLRTDMETLMKATAVGIASHQLLPNEARAMAERPPFTPEEQAISDAILLTVSPSGMPKSVPAPGEIPPPEGTP